MTSASRGRIFIRSFVLLIALAFSQSAFALPNPAIAPSAESTKEQSVDAKQQVLLTTQTTSVLSPSLEQTPQQPDQQLSVGSKAAVAYPKTNNNAEKLKRGLTNFMNQLNPAPFFVPAAVVGTTGYLQQQQVIIAPQQISIGNVAKSQISSPSSGETAAIVNGDSTVDVLITSPNRLSQRRPIGGPLRWGRRR